MSFENAPALNVLGVIGYVCVFYLVAWDAYSRKSPIKHTAIALLVGNSTLPVGIVFVKLYSTEFHPTGEWVSEITGCVSGPVGRALMQAFILSCFLFASIAAFIKFGPHISWLDVSNLGMGDVEMGHGSFKKLSARECTEIKIELLEEMLQVQRAKLKQFG